MTRCTCGHTKGVHAYTNQIGSCAFPRCTCMRYVLEIKPTTTLPIKVEITIKKGT